ncbi:MAG: RsmB/NOP family class I SAM-dependent RNA methyltransferase [Coriobacteriales bacterium]|nr:RsmB/NOP family class I SAM-dependent RNA methyltransferase [Coriobacteriales bacterium]
MIPSYAYEQIKAAYSEDDVSLIEKGWSAKRPQTLRANTIKTTAEDLAKLFDDAGLTYQRVPWYQDAFIMEKATHAELEGLESYREGLFYMQSLSSMIPALVVNPKPGSDILDMCAAPGGKTTQLAALSSQKAHITACEMHVPRAEKLRFNLERQGVGCVNILRQDSRNLDDFFTFDTVLIDAPCSGSGTLYAQDPRVAERFTAQLVQKSVKAQRALLKKAFKLTRPGNSFVYSTCSILPQENEQQVESLLKSCDAKIVPIHIENSEDIPLLPTTLTGALLVRPSELFEGFFVARIQRCS